MYTIVGRILMFVGRDRANFFVSPQTALDLLHTWESVTIVDGHLLKYDM
jgi:hypothetical protein